MKVVFTAHAHDDIEQRFAYTTEHFGVVVAERIFGRVDKFIHQTLARFPLTGRRHPNRDILESWVPRTPFFVIYSIDQSTDTLTVLAVYHHGQDRSSFEPTS